MSLTDALRSVLTNYANFSGRASRSEYWWWVAAYLGLMIAMYAVIAALQAPVLIIAVMAFFLLTFIPNLAVLVRRLHDTGRSGWWVLISFVPFGGLVLLVMVVMGTQPMVNRWGPPPKGSPFAASASLPEFG